MRLLSLLIRILHVLLAVIFVVAANPWRAFGTRCDCRPEYAVYAEAEGVCELTRDDRKWCEIKFNSSTGRGARQAEFVQALSKFGVEVSDNFTAAQQFNMVEPEKWDNKFIDEYLTSLLAVALWERAPDRVKPIIELVRNASEQILKSMKREPKEVDKFPLAQYTATVSRGCLDLADEVFAVMIKTRFSEANERCGFILDR